MKSCLNCQASLKPGEPTCQTCGTDIAKESAKVADRAPSIAELSETYFYWLELGKKLLNSGNHEESVQSLREAVKRSRVLEDKLDKEIEARLLLAQVLEKQNKTPEAADQYRIIAQETPSSEMREVWLKRSQDLIACDYHVTIDLLFEKEDFRTPSQEEQRYIPLYCSGCKRLLTEPEIYGFRRGMSATVLCWCGTSGGPLAKKEHGQEKEHATRLRARAIETANSVLPEGKVRSKAYFLALFLGWCGGHKFYLGETVAGWIYLFWFWTFVPFLLSLYEALILIQMSTVSFNMTYNLDLVLAHILPEEAVFCSEAEGLSTSEHMTTEEVVSNDIG